MSEGFPFQLYEEEYLFDLNQDVWAVTPSSRSVSACKVLAASIKVAENTRKVSYDLLKADGTTFVADESKVFDTVEGATQQVIQDLEQP